MAVRMPSSERLYHLERRNWFPETINIGTAYENRELTHQCTREKRSLDESEEESREESTDEATRCCQIRWENEWNNMLTCG